MYIYHVYVCILSNVVAFFFDQRKVLNLSSLISQSAITCWQQELALEEVSIVCCFYY